MNTLKGIAGCTIGATAALAVGLALRVSLGMMPTPTFATVVISLGIYVLFGAAVGLLMAWDKFESGDPVRVGALACGIIGASGIALAFLAGGHLGWVDAGTALVMTMIAGAAGGYGFRRVVGPRAASKPEALCATCE